MKASRSVVFSTVPLKELAREAIALVAGQVKEKDVRIAICPDLPVIYGDRLRLREVLQNLIDNAVKYMGDQPQPRIEIGARQDGGETICYVRDNGIGIDRKNLKRVFHRFYRVEDQEVRQRRGTGLGLFVVWALVKQLGGSVQAFSEGRGLGTTMRVELPVARAMSG